MNSPRDRFRYRKQFIQDIDASILRLDRIQSGKNIVLDCFRMRDDNALEFRLCFDGRDLMLPNDDHILTSKTFDELIEQLDQIKTIAGFGGFDDALSVASLGPDSTRSANNLSISASITKKSTDVGNP